MKVADRETIRVAIADKMVAEACVSCHNKHPQTPKNDWKIGDVRGILEVNLPISAQLAQTATITNHINAILVASILLALMLYDGFA